MITREDAESLEIIAREEAREERKLEEHSYMRSETGRILGETTTRPEMKRTKLASEDDYPSKVVKYIPVEIVAGFLTLDGILSASSVPTFAHWLVFILLLVLTPIYTWRFTTVRSQAVKKLHLPPAKAQIIIATVSFLIWVFAIGGPFKFLSGYNPVYGSVLLILFTFFPPLLIGKAGK